MPHVYVLYTGGTIGCHGQPLAPMPGPAFAALVDSMPGLAGQRVQGYETLRYTIRWLDQILDSSNMTPADWVTIAQHILSVYPEYDGFVVLHGTDTMSWTSSALSFLLRGLNKPVVLTGSQVPLAFPLTDGLRNLTGAITIAGGQPIPEVCLCFDALVLRGNRAVKVNASQFAAFASPNYPPLGTLGIETVIDWSHVRPPPPPSISLGVAANLAALRDQLARLAPELERFSVISLVLFPGMHASMLQAIFQQTRPPIRGVVLGAFGEGNAPSNPEFLAAIAAAHREGVVIVDGTQVLGGGVNIGAYQTGSGLGRAGAISAHDLTPEASLAKLIYLLARGDSPASIAAHMARNMRGEMASHD